MAWKSPALILLLFALNLHECFCGSCGCVTFEPVVFNPIFFSFCASRRWELFASCHLSIHAGRSGHRPRASENPSWCFERDRHRRLQSPLPGRADPVSGVHPDRTALHHHGIQITLGPLQKCDLQLCPVSFDHQCDC